MNKLFQLILIGGTIAFSSIALTTASHSEPKQSGIPLRAGTYYEAGSKYITIVGSQGNFCFWGGSANGITMASLRRDRRNPIDLAFPVPFSGLYLLARNSFAGGRSTKQSTPIINS
jgi:hypothetical protein